MTKYLFVFILLFSPFVNSGGLQASFNGSSLPGPRSSQIFRFDGTTDGSGNLIDTSGENLTPKSETFDTWTSSGNSSIIADTYKNPLNESLTADVWHENSTAGAWRSIYITTATQTAGHTYTASVYVRSINRRYISFTTDDVAFGIIADLTSGTITHETGIVTNPTIQKIISGWYRIYFTYISIGHTTFTPTLYMTDSAIAITATNGLDQDSYALYGAQIVDNTDGFIVGPGIYHSTTATTKPRLDLAPTGVPTSIESHLQGSDGNRMKARSFNGVGQNYSKADTDCADINDSDHTYTFVVRRTGASYPTLYNKGTYGASGLLVQVDNSGGINAYYSSGAGAVGATASGMGYDPLSRYNIVQIKRSSDIVTVYVDGTAGTPVNVATRGIDNAGLIYLGTAPTFVSWNGDILYSSLDNRALSSTELQQDRQQIQGILAGHKGRTSW